ncbi:MULTISPECIES: polysaccharide deacetylase family protein [unclassified Amycolatopsis]|uniref:polysaccharide deacetylase family protein n=1 Tax=unclassified Amycolatopsis TaxID=2618356 RepID=UPI002E112BA3|nr:MULTISPECIES: polysaccharide deacetylase family protein [unclassified Amycolatopsis]WSJ82197.1 polysaccharide deacetylase family protein [Amycolatopsis sp. NBC_01307]WSK83858.1 polysaccharide deacetylase family protein [Amycolatopsis sp. NBC_01286]
MHGIGRPARQLEPGENERWVTVEQFDRILDAVEERADVHLTFDDGNESDVEIALPRLVERGLTAEFFPLAGRLGQRGYLDHDALRDLARAGMEIGSHGWEPRDWRRLDDRHARRELTDAPKLLGDLCGRPVRRYSLPFGAYDRRVLDRLREAGATRVYASDGGETSRDGWLQPRTELRHDLDQEWLDGVLSGGRRRGQWMRRLFRRADG